MKIRGLLNLPRHSQSEAEESLASGVVETERDRQQLAQHLGCVGAISRACRDGYEEVVRLLLEYGATPIYINLSEAIERGHIAVVRPLLERVSPMLLAESLPILLIGASREMIELILLDERCEPSLATAIITKTECVVGEALLSYVAFRQVLIEGKLSGIASLDWLIERGVPEAQRAAAAIVTCADESSECRYQSAYHGYFSYMLGRDSELSELAWILIRSRRA